MKGDHDEQAPKIHATVQGQLVLEELTGMRGSTQICREYSIRHLMLSRWKQEFLEHAPEVFERGGAENQYEEGISELERMVGRLAKELEISKKTSRLLSSPRKGKWELTTMLSKEEHYPVTKVCEVLELPRNTYYREIAKGDEQALRTAVEDIVREFPTYGSRRVAAQLRRAPYEMVVNRKRVQRVMREMGLQTPVKRRKWHTADSEHPYARYRNVVSRGGISEQEIHSALGYLTPIEFETAWRGRQPAVAISLKTGTYGRIIHATIDKDILMA